MKLIVITLKKAAFNSAYYQTPTSGLSKQPEITGHRVSFGNHNIIREALERICSNLNQQITILFNIHANFLLDDDNETFRHKM